jgi:DNA processing protein
VRLTEAQRLDWLRLIRSDNVGPRGLRAHLHQLNDFR